MIRELFSLITSIFFLSEGKKCFFVEKNDYIHINHNYEIHCIEGRIGRVFFVKQNDKMYVNYNNEIYCIKNDMEIDWSNIKKGQFLKKNIRNKLEENTFFCEVFDQGGFDHVLYVGCYATLKGNVLTIFNFSLTEKLKRSEKDSIGEIMEVNPRKKIILVLKK